MFRKIFGKDAAREQANESTSLIATSKSSSPRPSYFTQPKPPTDMSSVTYQTEIEQSSASSPSLSPSKR